MLSRAQRALYARTLRLAQRMDKFPGSKALLLRSMKDDDGSELHVPHWHDGMEPEALRIFGGNRTHYLPTHSLGDAVKRGFREASPLCTGEREDAAFALFRYLAAICAYAEDAGAMVSSEYADVERSATLSRATGIRLASKIVPGTLLVAHPMLLDDTFSRSVVLLCETCHDRGSLGVMINSPTRSSLEEVLVPGVDDLLPALRTSRVHLGGPVMDVQILHRSPAWPYGSTAIPFARPRGDAPVLAHSSSFSLLSRASAHEDAMRYVDLSSTEVSPADVAVFSGSCTWEGGQLESEVASGSWIPVHASESTVASVVLGQASQADGLWSMCLRALGGEYAAFAELPHFDADAEDDVMFFEEEGDTDHDLDD